MQYKTVFIEKFLEGLNSLGFLIKMSLTYATLLRYWMNYKGRSKQKGSMALGTGLLVQNQ